MKTLELQPINEQCQVKTNTRLLDALLAEKIEVPMACRGKGICATCHVHIKSGAESLTPRGDREKKTLSMISGADERSRLACQCRVIGDDVVVELPDGVYFDKAEDLTCLVGTRSDKNLLHPITGIVLIAKGKLVTRSRLEELKRLNAEVEQLRKD